MINSSINDKVDDDYFFFEKQTHVTVYTYGEVCVHRHEATGYKIYKGFLLIVFNDLVIATYNHDQWVSVRV